MLWAHQVMRPQHPEALQRAAAPPQQQLLHAKRSGERLPVPPVLAVCVVQQPREAAARVLERCEDGELMVGVLRRQPQLRPPPKH
eukprot:5715140-Prymnesium_polylepis.1